MKTSLVCKFGCLVISLVDCQLKWAEVLSQPHVEIAIRNINKGLGDKEGWGGGMSMDIYE